MARDFVAASTQSLSVSSAPVTAAPLTMACWFNPDAGTAARTLMAITDTGSSDQYFRLTWDETAGTLDAETRSGGTISQATKTGATEGAWNHACGVYASTTSRIAYVNGVAGTTDTNATTPSSLDTMAIGALLRSPGGTNVQYMDGLIAEAAVWGFALTADEVAALAKGLSPLLVRPDSLVAYWPIYGRASPEPDLVGGYALTLNGSPAQSDHPPIIRRRRAQIFVPKVAAGGGGGDTALESDGASTATAIGASLASGNASSTGTGSATATGAALASGALSASGSGAATFVGDSEAAGFEDGDLSATGTGSASAVGASLASGVLSAAGSATATFVGDSDAAGVEEGDLSAAGTGAATLGGAAVAAGAFSMAGTSSAEFKGASEGGAVATRHEGRRPRVNVVEMNNRRMRQWAFVANAVIQRAA